MNTSGPIVLRYIIQQNVMHVKSKTSILYFGTPVVLISTKNENGSDNLAPMSSVFWLGWRCVIGLAASSKTTENLKRSRECVLNLPSGCEAGAVNRLAKTTGSNPVPPGKIQKGYRHERNKFGLAGLSAEPSATVAPFRVAECPVQMECTVVAVHGLADEDAAMAGKIVTFELLVKRVYLEESILQNGNPDKVDPDRWKPLMMSFQEFYTLGDRLHVSTLAEIPETLYNTPDREKALMAL